MAGKPTYSEIIGFPHRSGLGFPTFTQTKRVADPPLLFQRLPRLAAFFFSSPSFDKIVFSQRPRIGGKNAVSALSKFSAIGGVAVKLSVKIEKFNPRSSDIDINEPPNHAVETIMSETDDKALVAQILSSYLANNMVAANELHSVIESVKRAFGGALGATSPPGAEAELQKWSPAVPIKKSISSEELTCLCCGEKFKSLKRHLQTAHQLTPEGYRAAFDLKRDYPLVAPAYAARRSDLAKSLGLGRKPGPRSLAKMASPKGKPAKKVAAAA
jgi:predicted transcriptional regulator